MHPRRRLMLKKKARAAANVEVVNVVETAHEPTLQDIATETVAASVTKATKKVVTKKRSARKTAATKKK